MTTRLPSASRRLIRRWAIPRAISRARRWWSRWRAPGVQISDGATNILPVGPHRGEELSEAQLRENREAVHGAWRLAFEDTLHSLRNGIYEGWDLHPAQLVARYAAVYSFFLGGLPAASGRLQAFVKKAALASLFGDVFDDAATGQGLLNFFLRGIACGAITEEEALATGLTLGGNPFALVPENPPWPTPDVRDGSGKPARTIGPAANVGNGPRITQIFADFQRRKGRRRVLSSSPNSSPNLRKSADKLRPSALSPDADCAWRETKRRACGMMQR